MNRRTLLQTSGVWAATTVLAAWSTRRADCAHPPHHDSTFAHSLKVAMKIPFFFVDVFAEEPLSGNPLAVVPDADSLNEAILKKIAGELNQAETTFLLRPSKKGADWRIRSLTAPGHEIYGAGHNSLGAWWWLAESGRLTLREGENHFTQQIGESLLPVEIRLHGGAVSSVVLTQSPPEFGNIATDLPELAAALGLQVDDLDRSLPAQVVSTGAGHLLVPLKNRSVVSRTNPDSKRLAKLLHGVGGEGCYVYCLDPVSSSSAAHTRFFNPTMGIVEDSATGTAAGPLACQLVKQGILKDKSTIRIEQGFEMKRPSILSVEVHGSVVRLGGRGVQVIEGHLRIA